MLRIGHGYDVHKLVTGRKLILGGVDIPYEYGLDGHSDADVLVHAIMDSILGALALGDIGLHFPDNAPEYSGANSLRLLAAVISLMNEHGYAVNNIDSTILCQKPKLRSYIDQMRSNLAMVCGCGTDRISVKATTEEGLGFTGNGEGIAAHAVCTIARVQL